MMMSDHGIVAKIKKQAAYWMATSPISFGESPGDLVDDALAEIQQQKPEQSSITPSLERTLSYMQNALRTHEHHDMGFVYVDTENGETFPATFEGFFDHPSDGFLCLERNGTFEYWRIDRQTMLVDNDFTVIGTGSMEGRGGSLFAVVFRQRPDALSWVSSIRKAYSELRTAYARVQIRTFLSQNIADVYRPSGVMLNPRALFGTDADMIPNWRNATKQLWTTRHGFLLKPVNPRR